MRSVFPVALALACACQRTEQPGGGASSATGAVAGQPVAVDAGASAGGSGGSGGSGGLAASGGSAPVASPSCVVPLSEEPAPAAQPAGSCPSDPGGAPELTRGYVTFVDAPGTPRVGVEIADSARERERGLMYRTGMPEEQGMLFSWTDERVRSFWMRNTCLPLDMLFITKDGFIAGILEQVPVLNDSSRSIPCPVAHVLELNAGYSRSHGLKPGTRVAFE